MPCASDHIPSSSQCTTTSSSVRGDSVAGSALNCRRTSSSAGLNASTPSLTEGAYASAFSPFASPKLVRTNSLNCTTRNCELVLRRWTSSQKVSSRFNSPASSSCLATCPLYKASSAVQAIFPYVKDTRRTVFRDIESFYNSRRLHQTLGTPATRSVCSRKCFVIYGVNKASMTSESNGLPHPVSLMASGCGSFRTWQSAVPSGFRE